MTIHKIFSDDHAKLRARIQEVEKLLGEHSEKLDKVFQDLHTELRAHFHKEDDVYYPHIDRDKKIGDRELMHTLRNDHAAVVFALESLSIRLRKRGPIAEWKTKFQNMTKVLLPHFEAEEKKLFPEVEGLLPADEFKMLYNKVQALE